MNTQLRISLSGETPHLPASLGVSEVGLLRSEFILRARGEYISRQSAVDALQAYTALVCSNFAPGNVWYRAFDLWSDEAALLSGCGAIQHEHNPIIGARGIRRAADSAALSRELSAMAEVARRHKNLHIIAPFIQDADEFRLFVEQLNAVKWPNRFGSMIEIPSAVYEVRRMQELGASNFLIGMNDLTSLMLGRERGPPELKLHRCIWSAIERVAADVVNGSEWGLGGGFSGKLLNRAREAKVPYITVHYGELPDVLGVSRDELPDVDHVREIKRRKREASMRA